MRLQKIVASIVWYALTYVLVFFGTQYVLSSQILMLIGTIISSVVIARSVRYWWGRILEGGNSPMACLIFQFAIVLGAFVHLQRPPLYSLMPAAAALLLSFELEFLKNSLWLERLNQWERRRHLRAQYVQELADRRRATESAFRRIDEDMIRQRFATQGLTDDDLDLAEQEALAASARHLSRSLPPT